MSVHTLDVRSQFCEDQTVATPGGVASTNYLDMKTAGGFPANAMLAYLVDQLGTSDTMDITIQQDDNSSFSSPTTVLALNQVAADMTAWAFVALNELMITERYVRLLLTTGGTGETGRVSAHVTPDV